MEGRGGFEPPLRFRKPDFECGAHAVRKLRPGGEFARRLQSAPFSRQFCQKSPHTFCYFGAVSAS